MKFKRIEKHNVVSILRNRNLLEFTKEELVNSIKNESLRGVIYSTWNLSNILQDLVNEGILIAHYVSIKVEHNYYKNCGNKSVAVYKLKK